MRVIVCGVGALGSTAVVLCRSLGVELRLVDFDRVESKNLQGATLSFSTWTMPVSGFHVGGPIQ